MNIWQTIMGWFSPPAIGPVKAKRSYGRMVCPDCGKDVAQTSKGPWKHDCRTTLAQVQAELDTVSGIATEGI